MVLEDYKKNYTAIEIKSKMRKKLKDIFPLPHIFKSIGSDNYFEEITQTIKRD